jgi:hypothetical protein
MAIKTIYPMRYLLGVIILGMLLIPLVSAGTSLNYLPNPISVTTLPEAKYASSSSLIELKTGMSSTYSSSRGINPGIFNPISDISRNIGTLNQETTSTYIPEDEAIRIATESFTNISLTTDPSATLTLQRYPLGSQRQYPSIRAEDPVWVVEVSGVSTDPNAFGSLWYRNSRTGELVFVPTHEGGWVTIDAVTGEVISIGRCM